MQSSFPRRCANGRSLVPDRRVASLPVRRWRFLSEFPVPVIVTTPSLAHRYKRRPDYLVLTKTCLEDYLVWRMKGLDGGALAVLARVPCVRTPPMAGSGLIPATATFTAPGAGIGTKLTTGNPLG